MAPNPRRGEAELELDQDQTLTLVLDWHAVARLVELEGKDWDQKILEAFERCDLAAIAEVVAIAAARHHPELTAADIMAASPPFGQVRAALYAATSAFYWGTAAPPEMEADETVRPLAESAETRSALHWLWRLAQGFRPSSSGA